MERVGFCLHPLAAHSAAPHRYITHSRRVAQVVCLGVSKAVCHPSVMSHMLPHLPQNTSTRSLSRTSPVFRPSSPSLSGLDFETLRDPHGVANTLNLHLREEPLIAIGVDGEKWDECENEEESTLTMTLEAFWILRCVLSRPSF